MLNNGMGGIDWAGLNIVAAHLGVVDAQAFIDALETIITYEAPGKPTQTEG